MSDEENPHSESQIIKVLKEVEGAARLKRFVGKTAWPRAPIMPVRANTVAWKWLT